MLNKYTLLVCCLLLAPAVIVAQEETPNIENLLVAPEGWRPERIPFPLPFAASLSYEGIEDIRFAPGWSEEGSEDFWSYAFLWYLNADPALNANKLQEDLETYFDGLMQAVAKDKEIPIGEVVPTMALFLHQPEQSHFKGRVRAFDSFFLKRNIALNMLVYPEFCHNTQKYIVLFRVSPQPFTHPIWETMDDIRLIHNCNPE